MATGWPVVSLLAPATRVLLKKGPGCWLSNESCANWKRAPRVCDLELSSAEQAAKLARTRLVGLEDAVVYLNEAIGREEREAMTRELTADGPGPGD